MMAKFSIGLIFTLLSQASFADLSGTWNGRIKLIDEDGSEEYCELSTYIAQEQNTVSVGERNITCANETYQRPAVAFRLDDYGQILIEDEVVGGYYDENNGRVFEFNFEMAPGVDFTAMKHVIYDDYDFLVALEMAGSRTISVADLERE